MHTSVAEITIDFNCECEPPIFQEGEHVTGVLKIEVKEDVKIKGVHAEVYGVAFVNHEGLDEEDLDDINVPHTFTNKETYLSKNINLLPSDENQAVLEDGTLPSGEYSLPFHFKLPQELPSTFEGSYGHIKYWVKGVLTRENKPDIENRSLFRVISGLDLNFIPAAADKIEICKRKAVGGLCCTSGEVVIDWNVSKSGFIPGEDIFIHGAVQNDSKETVLYSRATLVMVIHYRTKKGKKKKEQREVCKVSKGETDSGTVTVWQETLSIPAVPPTSYGRSKIIDIYYELQFYAMVEDDPYRPIEVTKDIYIGTELMDIHLMKSMYRDPFAVCIDDIRVTKKSSDSVDTLTKIIAVASVSEPTANPTAPSLTSIEQAEAQTVELDMASQGLAPERDPPFAPPSPSCQDVPPVAPSVPTAPTETMLNRTSPSRVSPDGSSEERDRRHPVS